VAERLRKRALNLVPKEIWINPEQWEVLAKGSFKNQGTGVIVALLIIEG